MFLKKYANLRRFREYYARYGARTALLAVCMLTASSMGVVLSYFMSEQLVDISNVALAEMIRVTGVILAAALVLMCALWLFPTGQITVVVLLLLFNYKSSDPRAFGPELFLRIERLNGKRRKREGRA